VGSGDRARRPRGGASTIDRLVLASASPRRRDLLGLISPEFEVVPSRADETLDGPATPAAIAAIAARKARAVAAALDRAIVLGADTVVVLDGEALGKPRDPAEARAMLGRLRGRTHVVITGVAAVDAATGRLVTGAAETAVMMADYPAGLVEAYVASGAPLDKAGAYGIQDCDGALVAGWIGPYSNVVGLPLDETRRVLVSLGATVRTGAAAPRAAAP
jgi:septum formation protein